MLEWPTAAVIDHRFVPVNGRICDPHPFANLSLGDSKIMG
jgi:hypothetical protein